MQSVVCTNQRFRKAVDMQVAREANAELLDLPAGWEAADPAALLAAVANELHSVQEPTRMAALLWLNTLLSQSRRTVRARDLGKTSMAILVIACHERVSKSRKPKSYVTYCVRCWSIWMCCCRRCLMRCMRPQSGWWWRPCLSRLLSQLMILCSSGLS